MVILLENIFQISAIALLLCAIYYYRHFKKTKRESKLTSLEFSMFLLTEVAIYLCGGSYIILLLDRGSI